jgi:hypothetical protein
MAYLLIVVGVSTVGIGLVLLHQRGQRGPRNMGASIDHFSRTRTALSPDASDRVTLPAPDVLRRDQQGRHRADDTEPENIE